MRHRIDPDNMELGKVLETLLFSDTDITIRAVARAHPSLKNPSDFTRDEARMVLIEAARQRQAEARQVRVAPLEKRSAALHNELSAREDEVAELRAQVGALVSSHLGCIRAVALVGGMKALERFWAEYKSVGDKVHESGAIPPSAEVLSLTRKE